MNNNDLIQRFIFENLSVRGEWVRINESYRSIVLQHQYPPLIKQLLGEMLVVTCLLTAIIKFKGRLTVQFQGKNKLKLLMVQSDHEFHMRGIAQWDGDIEAEEVSSLFKQGVLVITIDPMTNGQRYQGIVAWEGHSIAESIEGYFRNSEQLPTKLWITVNEESSTGILLQALPKEEAQHKKENQDLEHLTHLTNTVTESELATLDATTLLRRLYSEEEIRLFDPISVTFRCSCSIERCENALRLMGQKEVDAEMKEKQKVVVTCEFCNTEYTFGRIDVARIFNQDGKPPASTQLH